MKTYRATATRSGEYWAIEVPELPGTFAQSETEKGVEDAAREAISLMLDVEPETFSVAVERV